MMIKKSKYIISAVLCAGLLLSGCAGSEQEQETVSAVLVDAQTVGRGNLVLSNQFVGTVSPAESVYIIPLAQGTVTETFFEVGDEVKEGDVLFKIDDSSAQLQLQQAELTYTNAQLQADSVLTTQQESTNLQLESNYSSAFQAYQTYQLQYFNAMDAKDQAEDAVDTLEEAIAALEEAIPKLQEEIAAYKQTIPTLTDEEEVATKTAELEAKTAQLAKMNEQLTGKKDENGESAGLYEQLVTAKALRKQARDAFASIKVAYDAAERTLNTLEATKELTQGDALEDTKEQLNTSLELAELGVESAKLMLSYYQVTTPISGKVIAKNVEVNSMATSANYAYVVADQDTMVVTFQVSESIMNTLQKDQKIKVERNGVEFDGVITEVGNAVNMQTGLFQIKADVHVNGAQLPSGVSVKITSDTYTADNQIVIPYDAVYYDTQGSYVYVAQGGHAVKTYVTTGIFNDSSMEITGGISVGDTVITSWSPRLLDGVEVDVRVADSASAGN